MFEAVIAVCLSLSAETCRDQLVPGYEAETRAGCEAALQANPPQKNSNPTGALRCQLEGERLPVAEIAAGVYVHMGEVAEPGPANRGDVSNLGFVIGSDAVAVIDTGAARWIGEALWRSIKDKSDLPVRYVILTHMHPDHILGVSVFAEAGAQIVGHARLPRALSDRQANYLESLERLLGPKDFAGTKVVAPDRLVEETLHLDLGDRVLEVQAWNTAHTSTDVTVQDQTSGTLFAGDLVFDRHAPALDGDLKGWQSVLKRMRELYAVRLVPGHGGPVLDWPAGMDPLNAYLQVLEADTRSSIDTGQRLGDAVETIAQSEAGKWELFETYNPRNATVAYKALEWD